MGSAKDLVRVHDTFNRYRPDNISSLIWAMTMLLESAQLAFVVAENYYIVKLHGHSGMP
jgi:hypothetical protein